MSLGAMSVIPKHTIKFLLFAALVIQVMTDLSIVAKIVTNYIEHEMTKVTFFHILNYCDNLHRLYNCDLYVSHVQ